MPWPIVLTMRKFADSLVPPALAKAPKPTRPGRGPGSGVGVGVGGSMVGSGVGPGPGPGAASPAWKPAPRLKLRPEAVPTGWPWPIVLARLKLSEELAPPALEKAPKPTRPDRGPGPGVGVGGSMVGSGVGPGPGAGTASPAWKPAPRLKFWLEDVPTVWPWPMVLPRLKLSEEPVPPALEMVRGPTNPGRGPGPGVGVGAGGSGVGPGPGSGAASPAWNPAPRLKLWLEALPTVWPWPTVLSRLKLSEALIPPPLEMTNRVGTAEEAWAATTIRRATSSRPPASALYLSLNPNPPKDVLGDSP